MTIYIIRFEIFMSETFVSFPLFLYVCAFVFNAYKSLRSELIIKNELKIALIGARERECYLYVCGKQINNVVKRKADWILRFYAHTLRGDKTAYRSNSNDFIRFWVEKTCQPIPRCCWLDSKGSSRIVQIFLKTFHWIFQQNVSISKFDWYLEMSIELFRLCLLFVRENDRPCRNRERRTTVEKQYHPDHENIIIDFFPRLMRETYSWNRTVDRFIDERTAKKI